MTLPLLFMYICFGLWAIGILVIVIVAFYFPEFVQRSQNNNLSIYNPVHLIIIGTIIAWISMWCFRSMY